MIERDLELLARLAGVNKHLGAATLELFEHQDGGELPTAGVRELGQHLVKLGQHLVKLGADLLARAEELDGDPVTRVIIDPQPT